ncbi:tape measure protein [Biomphalaria pfeifferi]|uniref:Tape measure protein n=1 Tax=Biomphalaria pfeifferi TaxID=112525 RepID=A0AAD8ANH5_BIOPF|nr:tape measure protein [Biomphalaria pfeifferi]
MSKPIKLKIVIEDTDAERSTATMRRLENAIKGVGSGSKYLQTFQSALSSFSLAASVWAGGIATSLTNSFMSALRGLPSFVKELFDQASNFSQMSVSLAQFEGSAALAEQRIKSLMQVAAETPGLSFSSAVDGQKRLEAIGFEGDKATTILAGLAKVRILSGSTKEDFDAVVLNLTQIATGGQQVGQEIRELIGRMPAFAARNTLW